MQVTKHHYKITYSTKYTATQIPSKIFGDLTCIGSVSKFYEVGVDGILQLCPDQCKNKEILYDFQ